MHHGVRDFDAGGKAVEDEPAGLLLEDLDEFPVRGEIVFIAEQRRRQVAVESLGCAR